jgi:cell division protein FtsN
MTKLSPNQALTLYVLVVAFVFVAFVLGLLIGTGSVEREEVRPAEPSYEPVEDLEAELDFYDELSKPIEEVESKAPAVILKRDPKPKAKPEIVTEGRASSPERNIGKNFTIQVAAHSTREEAEQLLIRLSTKSFEGRIREPDTGAGDKYFRVWIGEFSSAGEAETYATQLKEAGFHTYIRKLH